MGREADRIWTCLDYVFECDISDHRAIKARKILSELQRKTEIYQKIRKMRSPLSMAQMPPRAPESNSQDFKYASSSPETRGSVDYTPQLIGRAPVQFAGVANGESLWAFPSQQSPEASSDTTSVYGRSSLSADSGVDDLMADIDWVSVRKSSEHCALKVGQQLTTHKDAFDALFPQGQNEDLIQAEFRFPDMPQLRHLQQN